MGRKIGFLTAVVALLLACAGSAQAAGSVFLCVPSAAGKKVVSGGSAGSCEADTTKVALPASADEQQTLLSILPHIRFVAGGEPTIRFSGVNVQVVNGTGDTSSANGLGNLIIGYNAHSDTKPQTGSHNLVLGTEQSFTSYGGLIGGSNNKLTGPFSAVFGTQNTASGSHSAVIAGNHNTASGLYSSVSGGNSNTASGRWSSVSGGGSNTASYDFSAVSGGGRNTARGFGAAVFGCLDVTVSKDFGSNPSLCP
jgi:hypothetical protein